MKYKAVLLLLCFVMCFNTDADIRNIHYSIDGGVSNLRNRHIQHPVETNGHPTDFYTCQNGTWTLLTKLDGWRKPSATATKIVKGQGWVGVTVKGEVKRTHGGSWETFELNYGGEVIQEIGWLSAAIPIPRRETVSTELYDYIEHAKADTGTFEFRAGTASSTGANSAGVQVALSNLTVNLTPGSHTGGSTSRTMSPNTYTVEFKKSPNDAQEGSSCGLIIPVPPKGSGSPSPTGSTPPSGSTPPPSYHACGVHETSVSGDHSLQASCSSSNANGTCTVTSFYACSSHTHSYPEPPPPPTKVACGGASYTGCSGAESRTKHHRSSCDNCDTNGYWTCGQYAYRHTTQNTCRRPGCGVTYYECQNGTCTSDSGTNPYHWAQ